MEDQHDPPRSQAPQPTTADLDVGDLQSGDAACDDEDSWSVRTRRYRPPDRPPAHVIQQQN